MARLHEALEMEAMGAQTVQLQKRALTNENYNFHSNIFVVYLLETTLTGVGGGEFVARGLNRNKQAVADFEFPSPASRKYEYRMVVVAVKSSQFVVNNERDFVRERDRESKIPATDLK